LTGQEKGRGRDAVPTKGKGNELRTSDNLEGNNLLGHRMTPDN
jgi:hypothetical protein